MYFVFHKKYGWAASDCITTSSRNSESLPNGIRWVGDGRKAYRFSIEQLQRFFKRLGAQSIDRNDLVVTDFRGKPAAGLPSDLS